MVWLDVCPDCSRSQQRRYLCWALYPIEQLGYIEKSNQHRIDLWGWLTDPSLRSFGFIGLYTLFFIFVYLTIYAFGHLQQEQTGGTS